MKEGVISMAEFKEEPPGVDLNALRRDIDIMRSTMAMQIEVHTLTAKLTKSKYEALIMEGFTEHQALILCK